RQFFTPIRHEPANDLSKGKSHPWPPVGMGFCETPSGKEVRFVFIRKALQNPRLWLRLMHCS
ncbi:MAG: hypothetical protein WCO91_13255, partial [Gemmataceae bacterium]